MYSVIIFCIRLKIFLINIDVKSKAFTNRSQVKHSQIDLSDIAKQANKQTKPKKLHYQGET